MLHSEPPLMAGMLNKRIHHSCCSLLHSSLWPQVLAGSCSEDASAACQAAQRKMLDVLNTVGLSDSLLRVIDRRHKLDRWLTYGGMVRRTTSCSAGPPCIHLRADKPC